MAPIVFILALLLPITCASAQVDASTLDVHTVPCTPTTTSCECRQNADVCVFTLKIELLHAFTRYYINPDNEERVQVARVYYFADDGNLYSHPAQLDHDFCINTTEDDVSQCSPTYTFDATTYKPFIGVNGQVPGPNLIVWEDQTVMVNVANELQMETVSIHWHGLYQFDTYFIDGVQHITQCAIDPQKSFRYIFKAQPSGTHWYHSHTGVQRSDGLFGALTVRELPATESQIRAALSQALRQYQDLPAEHTLVIADWFREDSLAAYSLLESSSWFYSHTGSDPPGPDDEFEDFTFGPDGKEAGNYPFWSALINGKGKHPDNSYPYLKSRLAIFSVDSGQVYRFRLIGSINNYAFRFSIDEHDLWVVGTDGHWVQPVPVNYIALQSGERYDFLLITKSNPPKSDYWMRTEALEIDMPDNTDSVDPPYRMMLDRAAESILHYNVQGASLPTSADYVRIKEKSVAVNSTCTSSNPCKIMNCPWNIHSAYNWQCTYVDSLQLLLASPESILPKATPDQVIFFQFGTEGMGSLSSVNGRRSLFPSVPPKLTDDDQEFQEIYNAEYCKNIDDPNVCYNVMTDLSNENCSCVHMRNLEYQKSYRFVYTVAGPHGTFSHPVHMHGHSFFVIKIGLPPINARTGFVECFSDDIECSRYPPGFGKCDYVTSDNPHADYTCPAPKWATGKAYTYPSATTNGNVPTPTASGKIDPRTPRKDTIMVPAGGYAIIDIVTDNPGVWFMHCHVENHAVEGMGVVLNEAQPNQNPSPPEMRKCGNFEPTLQDFYNWINRPTTPPPTTPPRKSFISCQVGWSVVT